MTKREDYQDEIYAQNAQKSPMARLFGKGIPDYLLSIKDSKNRKIKDQLLSTPRKKKK
jgi:hypothetical protein